MLARNAGVAEDLATIASEQGVQLIACDFPSQVMMAMTDFESDMIRKHLMTGSVEKLHESKPNSTSSSTQEGATKVTGSTSKKINRSNEVLKQLRVWLARGVCCRRSSKRSWAWGPGVVRVQEFRKLPFLGFYPGVRGLSVSRSSGSLRNEHAVRFSLLFVR